MGGVRKIMNSRCSKGFRRLLALFLLSVFFLEAILQCSDTTKVYAVNYSKATNGYYECGFDSYTYYDDDTKKTYTITREDVKRDFEVNKDYVLVGRKFCFLNTEVAIDYRKIVYGLPTDVPDNEFIENAWGYWYVKLDSKGRVIDIVTKDTPGAVRGSFKYLGYAVDGVNKVEDPFFPTEIEGITRADIEKKIAKLVPLSEVSKNAPQLISSISEPNSFAGITHKDTLAKIYENIINTTNLRIYSTTPGFNGYTTHVLNMDLGWVLTANNFTQYAYCTGKPGEKILTVYFFLKKLVNGSYRYYRLAFSGYVGKFLPPKEDIETRSITVMEVTGITDSGEELQLQKDQKGRYIVDPAVIKSVQVKYEITGIFNDYYTSLKKGNALAWWYIRYDVKSYLTVINYLRLANSSGVKDLSNLVMWNKTGDNRYKTAFYDTQEYKDDYVPFWGYWLDVYNLPLLIDTNQLQSGENILTASGKVRVFFPSGYHVDAYNSRSTSITLYVPSIPKPEPEANAKPSEIVLAKYNNQYFVVKPKPVSDEFTNMLNTQGKVPVSVVVTASADTSKLYYNTKISKWEIKVYKRRYDSAQGKYVPVDEQIFTPDDAGNGQVTVEAKYYEPVTNIAIGQTYTPSYYIEARYQTTDGRWSSWAQTNTRAAITVTDPVEITKSVSPQGIFLGDRAVFTVKVRNLVDTDIANVKVKDTFAYKDSKQRAISASTVIIESIDTPDFDQATGIWNIGRLSGNETRTMQITVKGFRSGYCINTAQIVGTSKKASATLRVVSPLQAKITLTKTVDKPDIFVGDTATFIIKVTNDSEADIQDTVVIEDTIYPPKDSQNTLQVIKAVTDEGIFDIKTMKWTIKGGLSAGETATALVTVKALPFEDGYKATSKVFDNVVGVVSPPGLTAVALAQLTVHQPKPDIRVTKTVDKTIAKVGDTVTFTVTVANATPKTYETVAKAQNVRIIDEFTPRHGFSILSVRTSKGVANITTTGGVWDVGSLDAGESATMTIVAQINSKGTYTNTAYYEADPSRRDSATVTTNKDVEGNLTVANVFTTDSNGKPVDTIDKPLDVRVKAYITSIFPIAGTTTVRLYRDGTLLKTQQVSLSAFEAKEVDFGYIFMTGACTISVTASYNRPYFGGDDDGMDEKGNVNPWIELFSGKRETRYSDNVFTKSVIGRSDIVYTDGGLRVDFEYTNCDYDPTSGIWKAKVGDTVRFVNTTVDTNYTYNYVVRNLYDYYTAPANVSYSTSPTVNYAGTYEVATQTGKENAKYESTFEWWLPETFYSANPFKGSVAPSITLERVTGGSIQRPVTKTYTAYHHEWLLENRTYERWIWIPVEKTVPVYNEEGEFTGYTTVIDHYYSTYSPINTTVYSGIKSNPVTHQPLYNLIATSDYVKKRYTDDQWTLESVPHYDLYVLLTAYDYYTLTNPRPSGGYDIVEMSWAWVPQHFAYAYKPLRVYYNNPPVAYFNVVGGVNVPYDTNNLIKLQDLSYDPDNDPISEFLWEIDGQRFTTQQDAEVYLNTVVKTQPGQHVIKLKVKDNPVLRYNRLEPRWSLEYSKAIYVYSPNGNAVSYKAKLTFDRNYIYTKWHKTKPEEAIDPEQHSYVKVHVKVWDIGYWTQHKGTSGEKILEFKKLNVRDVPQPYARIVRYKNMGTMVVQPYKVENLTINGNSFEYDAWFMFEKAGRYNLDERTDSTTGIPQETQDSKMIFPFVVEELGLCETLIKDHFAVNAFNPTEADPPREDVTKFYSIGGVDDGNINHLDLGVKVIDWCIRKDGVNQYIPPDPLTVPPPQIGYRKERISELLSIEYDRQVFPY